MFCIFTINPLQVVMKLSLLQGKTQYNLLHIISDFNIRKLLLLCTFLLFVTRNKFRIQNFTSTYRVNLIYTYINTTPLLLPKYYHSVLYSHLLRIKYDLLSFAVPYFTPVLISILYLNSMTLAKKN